MNDAARKNSTTETRPDRLIVLCSASPHAFPHLRKFPPLLASLGIRAEYWCWAREPRKRAAEEIENVKVLSTFPSRPFALLLVGYAWWMVCAFWAVLWSRSNDAFLCERFESAFPAALVTLLRRRRILFYNSDNLFLSYRWSPLVRRVLFALERFAVSRSEIHLVPSESRWPEANSNRRLLQNWPSRHLAEQALRIARDRQFTRTGPLRVYVNGWLPETRGLRMIAAAAERLHDTNVRFIVSGRENGPSASRLITLPNVEYLGVLTADEALAQCYRCHVVLTFYDPSIEINRVAEPNKWADCVVTQTPFITNDGVLTAKPYLSANACLSVPYDDEFALENLLRRLAAEPRDLEEVSRNLGRIPKFYWDELMEQIIREFLQRPAEYDDRQVAQAA